MSQTSRKSVWDEKMLMTSRITKKSFYRMLGQNGLGFGPSFHRVTSGSYGSQIQVMGTIKLFKWPGKEHPQAHIIHPTSLDAIFHLAIAGHCEGGAKGIPTMVPTFLQKLSVSKHGLQFSDDSDVHECAWTIQEDSLAVHFDGFVLNPSRDKILVQFENLKLTRIGELLEYAKSSMISQSHQRPYNFQYRPDPWLLSEREIWEYCQQGLHASQNLILLSRSGPRTNAAYKLLEEIQSQGIRVETPASDITKTELMRKTIKSLSSIMPPIKGCLQASLIAKDGLFRDMEYDSWKHTVDSNYNAGNTYEDALARYRVSKGEKAISLDLGAMVDDGILAENTWLLDRVLTYGALEPINRETYFTLLEYYCNPSLPLLSPIQSQAAMGLGAGGGCGLESIDFSRSPILYPLVLQNTRQAVPPGVTNQAEYREMIAASGFSIT
ncbi:hypothetical protein EAF04_010723 [Stromatinia cepivora]|nr:hypothetical protein EAF04_010723 [Stromatinia cepivora]